MNRTAFIAAVLLAAFIPAGAFAQGACGAKPIELPPISKDVRAKLEAAHAAARDAAFRTLTPEHRTRAQAIIDGITADRTADPRAAAKQIDTLLTPDESKAVLAEGQRLLEKLQSLWPPPGQGGPPVLLRVGGEGSKPLPGGGFAAFACEPTAGMTLLFLSVTPPPAPR